VNLNKDGRDKLAALETLVGKETVQAFVNVMHNASDGDRLARVLQFIIDDKFDDDVLKAWVECMVDPAYGIAHATDDEIKGMLHMIHGMVRSRRNRAASPQPAQPKPVQIEPQQPMEKSEVVAHLAAQCGISQEAVEAVLKELAELAVRETNARNVFKIPGIGIMVKQFREERMGRNPQTGEEILIRARTSLKFRLDGKVRVTCGETFLEGPPSSEEPAN
jgi:DNA-binding protein HU-beta